MKGYLFFDHASTTKCCEAAVQLVQRFAHEEFGNPSSSHAMGQNAARAIRDARAFFADAFGVSAGQVIFTGSGSEADNLAVYGVARRAIEALIQDRGAGTPPRVIASSIEHPAVRKTVRSLASLGVDVQLLPVTPDAQIDRARFLELLTPETVLISIQQVNNIVGSILPVEELAREAKAKVPGVIFHTDAVQAFGKVKSPTAGSAVDLVSISGHKVEGPKGIGSLIVLNPEILKKSQLKPLIWGGDQEGGMRSGTQNAGLIAGFHAAAERALARREESWNRVAELRERFEARMRASGTRHRIHWNSPRGGVPHIASLSLVGLQAGPLAKLLEEKGFLVSTGSACSSQKAEPDPVLTAMGLPANVISSALRVSFSTQNSPEDVDRLADSLLEAADELAQLFGVST